MPMWPKRLLANKFTWFTSYIWLLALIVRLYGIMTPPQYYDMATFQAWGAHMLAVGPVHFYENTWSDYLPLPLYIFAPIAALSAQLHLSFGILFKTVISALELLLIFGITKAWSYKGKTLVLAVLALSPVLVGDTAFWGQVDTIPALLALLSLASLSPIWFGLAVAIKPIMILLAPVIWIVSTKRGQAWWRFPLIAGLTFIATGIPMAGWHTLQLLWARTIEQAGTYPYTTINAWNLWSLRPDLSSWPPDSQSILSISAHTLGLLLFGANVLVVLRKWHAAKWEPKFAFRVSAAILITFYMYTTRMHERHLLFGLPFLGVAAVLEPWLLLPLSLLTGTFLLNLYGAFYWVNHAQVWPFSAAFVQIVSYINVATALVLTGVWHLPTYLQQLKKIIPKNKILVGVLLIATVLRLYNLSYPKDYIFDEVYHAFTAREYLHNHKEAWEWWTTPPPGVAYEWTHPPLAKYGMVLGMLLFGENSFGWRIGSATAGILCIWGIYLLTQAVTGNKKVAILAAFLLSIEGTHLAQSRIAMNDMYMLTLFVWSLYAAIKSRWKGAAILYGLALASKWSGIYGSVSLACIYLHQNNPKNWSIKSGIFHLLIGIRCLLIAASVYLLSFAPFILAGHTWAQLIELHRQMWYYHTHLVATHAYQSIPLQWIFAARPVWYYVNYGAMTSNIYVQGNPLILWLGLMAAILLFRKILQFRYAIFLMLYLIFTLPWIASPRIMFFYHYLPSATFLCVILATWLATLSKKVIFTVLALCTVSFVVIAPMLYGFPMPKFYWDTLFQLFPSWK